MSNLQATASEPSEQRRWKLRLTATFFTFSDEHEAAHGVPDVAGCHKRLSVQDDAANASVSRVICRNRKITLRKLETASTQRGGPDSGPGLCVHGQKCRLLLAGLVQPPAHYHLDEDDQWGNCL